MPRMDHDLIDRVYATHGQPLSPPRRNEQPPGPPTTRTHTPRELPAVRPEDAPAPPRDDDPVTPGFAARARAEADEITAQAYGRSKAGVYGASPPEGGLERYRHMVEDARDRHEGRDTERDPAKLAARIPRFGDW